MNRICALAVAFAALFLASASWAQSSEEGVDRLYIFDCGLGHAADESRWTVGSNIGKPVDIPVN
jgi:hypothetical protein